MILTFAISTRSLHFTKNICGVNCYKRLYSLICSSITTCIIASQYMICVGTTTVHDLYFRMMITCIETHGTWMTHQVTYFLVEKTTENSWMFPYDFCLDLQDVPCSPGYIILCWLFWWLPLCHILNSGLVSMLVARCSNGSWLHFYKKSSNGW